MNFEDPVLFLRLKISCSRKREKKRKEKRKGKGNKVRKGVGGVGVACLQRRASSKQRTDRKVHF